jgi:DNA-binding response OmpR family regulator
MSAPDARRPRIIVAEDDPALLKMLAKLLEPIGEIRIAADGAQALSIVQSMAEPPDLVVTDVMMPKLDGLQLAKSLKDEPRTSRVPVIMLTAKGGPRDVVSGINAGARHYLTKPFKHEDLLAKVKKVLGIA